MPWSIRTLRAFLGVTFVFAGVQKFLDPNFLHVNPYPNTAVPGQTKECEAGNEPFLVGKQVIGNVPGTQSATTEKTTQQR